MGIWVKVKILLIVRVDLLKLIINDKISDSTWEKERKSLNIDLLTRVKGWVKCRACRGHSLRFLLEKTTHSTTETHTHDMLTSWWSEVSDEPFSHILHISKSSRHTFILTALLQRYKLWNKVICVVILLIICVYNSNKLLNAYQKLHIFLGHSTSRWNGMQQIGIKCSYGQT